MTTYVIDSPLQKFDKNTEFYVGDAGFYSEHDQNQYDDQERAQFYQTTINEILKGF